MHTKPGPHAGASVVHAAWGPPGVTHLRTLPTQVQTWPGAQETASTQDWPSGTAAWHLPQGSPTHTPLAHWIEAMQALPTDRVPDQATGAPGRRQASVARSAARSQARPGRSAAHAESAAAFAVPPAPTANWHLKVSRATQTSAVAYSWASQNGWQVSTREHHAEASALQADPPPTEASAALVERTGSTSLQANKRRHKLAKRWRMAAVCHGLGVLSWLVNANG